MSSANAQVVDFELATIAREVHRLPSEWALIPVGGGKAPQYTDWQRSCFKAADFDQAVAAGVFAGALCKAGTSEEYTLPARYVKAAGVLCGEPSGGLLFFDHDGPSGDAKILELSGCAEIPEAMTRTPVVTSGRKGRYQAIYRVPSKFWGGIETTKIGTKFEQHDGRAVAVEGLEFRWTGAQSVVIGSHPQTDGYRWIYHPEDVAIAEAPMWMLEAMLTDSEADNPQKSWSEFDRSFSLPCDHQVNLLAACAPKTRNAIEQGATSKGRNDTGAQIARDLLGTANYLDSIGQRYDGDPKAIFTQWCDRFGLSQDKPKGQPKTIWTKAEKDRPSPSLNPTQIEGCLKSWVWKNAERVQGGAQQIQQVDRNKPQAEAADDDPLTAESLRKAVAEYALEEDVFERHLLARQLGADYGARGLALDSLTQALEPPSTGGVQEVSEIMVGVFDDIEARSMGKVVPGVKTGFYDLDAMTDGFQPSDLIVIAGRPAMGKTALAMGLGMGAALQGTKVLVFSLEMGKEQLVRRLLSAVCSIEATRLRAGKIGQHEWEPLGHAISNISRLPIVIDDTPEQTVSNMEAVAKKHSPQMIVVDHCQLLDGPGRDEYAKVTYNTKKLKALARKLDIPIVLLSQLSRAVEGTNTKRPAMSHLKQSGSIEQDADLVMMLYREEYYDPDTRDRGVAEVIIGKHRNGPTGTVKLLFESQYTRFRNMASSIG